MILAKADWGWRVRGTATDVSAERLWEHGITMHRLPALLAFALTLTTALPAHAQVAPSAPENLRCPGQPAPPLPGPDWKVEPVWEWREMFRVDGPIGSSDGPYAVALDRQCNAYLTDGEHFKILKLSPDGTLLAQWPLPGERGPGESSSPRGIAVDAAGNVYVSDTPRDRVYKYSPQGQVIATFGECAGGGKQSLQAPPAYRV